MKIEKVFMNWSSGKDCSLALYYLLKNKKFEVDHLFTTVSSENQRIGMHGLRESLLKAQAKSIGIPLKITYLPKNNNMETYSKIMQNSMQDYVGKGYTHSAFGDIYLEDLKSYRVEQLSKVGLKGLFPLWKKDTKEILKEFIEKGFKAIVVAASANFFNEDFIGTEIDESFLDKLPTNVDPCGENGEFHTFCYDGPIFQERVLFKKGNKIEQSYPSPSSNAKINFHFLDLIPLN